jgi:PAS domain S-box-containing protein
VRFRNDGEIIFANSGFAAGRGVTAEDLIGTSIWEPISEPDRLERRALLDQLTLDAPEYRVEMKFHTGEGERWMLWTTRALAFDDQGRWLEAQSTGVDIHDRKQAEEHTKLLLNELNHRVKNTLAVVQGIAQQTFKNTDPEARRAFEGRLAALSKAHSLLTERSWAPAPLRAIVEEVSHVCGAARDRIHADGPDVMLSPRQALSIAMALHELCTNAMKYGALSTERGVADLIWRVEGGAAPQLELVWRESGGPHVSAPKERGYGSMMIERALAHDLQGAAKLEFKPEGLVCTVTAPLEA